jgi:hypothetical protein
VDAALNNPRRGFTDPERVAQVVSLFMGGQPVTVVAKELRCDPHRVTKTLLGVGIDVYGIRRLFRPKCDGGLVFGGPSSGFSRQKSKIWWSESS